MTAHDDLDRLRKVAEDYRDAFLAQSVERMLNEGQQFNATFGHHVVLELLDELRNARITIEEDRHHFAKFWWDGFVAGWGSSGESWNAEHPGIPIGDLYEEHLHAFPKNPHLEES